MRKIKTAAMATATRKPKTASPEERAESSYKISSGIENLQDIGKKRKGKKKKLVKQKRKRNKKQRQKKT
jgi:hypothetical protein